MSFVQMVKFLRLSNVVDVINNFYELKSNIDQTTRYNMKTDKITDPNLIVRKFEGLSSLNEYKWTYSDLFEKINTGLVDGISFNEDGKFGYAIDTLHELQILEKNIHYVKMIPLNVNNVIDLLRDYHIPFDVL